MLAHDQFHYYAVTCYNYYAIYYATKLSSTEFVVKS